MTRKDLATAAVALAIGFGVGATVDLGVRAQGASSEVYRQLDLFGDVFEYVRSDYVEEVPEQKLIENAINGMLAALDPHSSYLDEKSFKDMQVNTRGEFGGLGIEVTMENGLVKVVSPIDETPAARAGLKPGDFVTHLDAEPILGLTLNEAVEKMRGPVNSDIKLTIRRGEQPAFDVTLTRAVIRIQSVRSNLIQDVGYVRITTFNEQTDAGLQRAVKRLKDEAGKKLIGFVVDLRNNPGGLLDQAVSVSDAFLDKGEIVSTKGRQTDDAQRFNAKPGDIAEGLPVVVLINGGSASASEIVAGALQDHRRAILLGEKSFGKGSVQTIKPIQGHGAVRLTTARYYTPSGRSIQQKGIDPDIAVEQAKIESTAAGQRRRESSLRGSLRNDQEQQGGTQPAPAPQAAPAQPGTPPRATQPPAQPPQGQQQPGQQQPGQQPAPPQAQPASPATGPLAQAEDYQLSRAVDLLRGLSLYKGKAN